MANQRVDGSDYTDFALITLLYNLFSSFISSIATKLCISPGSPQEMKSDKGFV